MAINRREKGTEDAPCPRKLCLLSRHGVAGSRRVQSRMLLVIRPVLPAAESVSRYREPSFSKRSSSRFIFTVSSYLVRSTAPRDPALRIPLQPSRTRSHRFSFRDSKEREREKKKKFKFPFGSRLSSRFPSSSVQVSPIHLRFLNQHRQQSGIHREQGYQGGSHPSC